MTKEIIFRSAEGNYLAFGTRHVDGAERNTIGAPWKIYCVSRFSGYYKVMGMDGEDFVVLQKLDEGSNEDNKLIKWVYDRLILEDSKASCRIREDKLTKLVKENSQLK